MNQFMAIAVGEKAAAMEMARFFAYRNNRADFAEFDRIMSRTAVKLPVRATNCRSKHGAPVTPQSFSTGFPSLVAG